MRTRHDLPSLLCLACSRCSLGRRSPHRQRRADDAPLRRFALVIGSNNGGGVREQLRYAGHDATTIADVLRQLGGVNDVDLSLLSEPDTQRGRRRVRRARPQRVRDERKRGQRVELVVYYSGHADETGILIGGAHYDYAPAAPAHPRRAGRRPHRDRR